MSNVHENVRECTRMCATYCYRLLTFCIIKKK